MKIYAVLYPNLEAVKKDAADKLRRAVRRFAKRATPPVRCWCGEKITHINWCLAHAPRCNSGAHFHGNCACEGPSAAFWEQWDRTNEARQK